MGFYFAFDPYSHGEISFPTYLQRRIIIDDGCPREENEDGSYKYTTYLFGEGAIGYGNGHPKVPFETAREARESGGIDLLIHRYHFIMHPRGMSWVGDNNPENEDLAKGSNWKRVYEQKKVPLVRFLSNG